MPGAAQKENFKAYVIPVLRFPDMQIQESPG